MSSVMSCCGRKFPSSPSEACVNIRHNMCIGWKVARLVTSTVLGVTGLALVVGCSAQSQENSAPTAASTVMDACKIAGVVYAVASGIDFGVSMVKTLVLPCILAPKNLDEKSKVTKKEREFCASLIWEYIPQILASSFGVAYGGIVLQHHSSSSTPKVEAEVVGGLSAAFYFLDVGIGLLDMCSFDQIKKMNHRQKKNQMLPALPEVGEDGQVIVQVEEEPTVSCCGKKGKKGKSEAPSPESMAMLPSLQEASPEASGDVIQQDPDPMPEPSRRDDLPQEPKEKGRQGLLCCCVKGKGNSDPAHEVVEMVPLEAQSVPEVSEDSDDSDESLVCMEEGYGPVTEDQEPVIVFNRHGKPYR